MSATATIGAARARLDDTVRLDAAVARDDEAAPASAALLDAHGARARGSSSHAA